ncbi:MAG TPA: hypothetical protein VGC20_01860 [bacterium]|jgi:hypothetical protein
MYKLDNLIISGFEVYSLPEPPRPSVAEASAPAHPAPDSGTGLLRALLVHTLAAGALPLPLPARRR